MRCESQNVIIIAYYMTSLSDFKRVDDLDITIGELRRLLSAQACGKWQTNSLTKQRRHAEMWFDYYIEKHAPYELREWKLVFDAARTRLGKCNHHKREISLSDVYLMSPTTALNDVQNTLLHEIAHALTPGAHHGPRWVRKARAIGCNGKRCGRKFASKIWMLRCTRHCEGAYRSTNLKERGYHIKAANTRKKRCRVCHDEIQYVKI